MTVEGDPAQLDPLEAYGRGCAGGPECLVDRLTLRTPQGGSDRRGGEHLLAVIGRGPARPTLHADDAQTYGRIGVGLWRRHVSVHLPGRGFRLRAGQGLRHGRSGARRGDRCAHVGRNGEVANRRGCPQLERRRLRRVRHDVQPLLGIDERARTRERERDGSSQGEACLRHHGPAAIDEDAVGNRYRHLDGGGPGGGLGHRDRGDAATEHPPPEQVQQRQGEVVPLEIGRHQRRQGVDEVVEPWSQVGDGRHRCGLRRGRSGPGHESQGQAHIGGPSGGCGDSVMRAG